MEPKERERLKLVVDGAFGDGCCGDQEEAAAYADVELGEERDR